jgi:hypothetical protein
MNHCRLRWARLNRDKDVDSMPRVTNSQRKNPKRKQKAKGTKTRDPRDPDTADVVKDPDKKPD